ncbi:hypothetical protein NPIL_676261 [Nephila pilipes]|uniref:Uncharacterized protein n=1 Tax=Nephila pilipes TaxID=299642 RepID=A0A8X6PHQ0_NEPPI|nr:hypothetical protein NPIL_676261 [Nephila pilipes]
MSIFSSLIYYNTENLQFLLFFLTLRLRKRNGPEERKINILLPHAFTRGGCSLYTATTSKVNIQNFTMIKDTRLSNMKISEKSISFSEDFPLYKIDPHLYRDANRQLEYWVIELHSVPPWELTGSPSYGNNNSPIKKICPKSTSTKS